MPRRTAYLIPLIVGLGLAVMLFMEYNAEQGRHAQQSRLDVFYKLAAVQGRLEDGLDSRLQLAGAIRSFVMLNPDMDQATFSALVDGLVAPDHSVRSVELARSNTISHIYPAGRDSNHFGRDLLTDYPLAIRDLVSQAMDSRHRRISLPLSMGEESKIIVSATPIYLQASSPALPREYWGIVLVSFDADALFLESGLNGRQKALNLSLRAVDRSASKGVLFGQGAVFEMEPVTMSVHIPDGYWQLGALPVDGWTDSPKRNMILFGGGGAILFATGLILATVYFLLGGIKEREKYRYLVQNAKSIILRIDTDGFITFCNEYAERFFGYEPGGLIGQPLVGTLVPSKSLDGKSMKRYINRLLLDPAAFISNEILNTRKNGEMVWVAWANEPVTGRDGTITEVLCVGTDITDRKLMEEALKQSERQYRVLAENVTDIIMGLDAGHRFTFVSPSDEALRGFGRHDVLSRPISDFLTAQSSRAFEESMARLLARLGSEGNPPSTIMDLEFLCADESTVWLETRFGLLLNEDRELIGLQGVGRDISDRKRADGLREDVERMARHDLRTPLGAVVGLPGEIRRLGPLTPTQEEMLSTIEDAGGSMLELINRSLDMFKMESGSYDLRKGTTDVLKVIESIKNETRTLLRLKGISVGVEVAGVVGADEFIVFAEEPLLKSMLSNLMLNAFQASPEGGSVSIVLSRNHVVRVAICNKGEVPHAVRETFFDRYSTSKTNGGSGIGTYSARLIARTHGGDISLDTTSPGETCVTVILP